MNNSELIEYVYLRLGGKKNLSMAEPMIVAVAQLSLKDLAQVLVDTNSSLAKKLVVTLSNQSWASSLFTAPTNMLFHKQKDSTRIDIAGTLAFQVEDRDKLEMLTGLGNHYYALEGKTFYIKHSSGTTSGNNLNITYYKIPALSDIDEELRNMFLELVISRIIPQDKQINVGQK